MTRQLAAMSYFPPEWCSYSNYAGFLKHSMREQCVIPPDWALHTTHLASEWVEQQFLAHVSGRPLVDPPPGLDMPTLLSCGQLALRMAEAYRHPSEWTVSSPKI